MRRRSSRYSVGVRPVSISMRKNTQNQRSGSVANVWPRPSEDRGRADSVMTFGACDVVARSSFGEITRISLPAAARN